MRIIALVAVPVLLLGAGCRGGLGARGGADGTDSGQDSGVVTTTTPGADGSSGGSSSGGGASGGSADSSPDGESQDGVDGQFDDIESTLNSIESEMAEDGR